jgi:TetR/AcrR family transcriptional regulator, tetracycline repressor protein
LLTVLPTRQQRAQPLSRAEILAAASAAVADAGVDGLSLRRLAADLGSHPPVIYRHFTDKRALLDELAQRILAARLPELTEPAEPPEGPAEWLHRAGHVFRQALLAHRDGARIVAGAGLPRAPILAELTELALGVLTRAGVELGAARDATHTVLTYTQGFVLEEQAEPQPAEVPDPGLLVRRFPLLAGALADRPDADAGYDRGLRWILAGFAGRA